MTTMFTARLLCLFAMLAPAVLALQPTHADAQGQPAPVVEMARVVDDRANLLVLPIVTLGATEKLYLRGADLAIVNSGACSLLARAERLECLEKLSSDIAPPPRPAMSPSSD
jgi:hypothetical protein